MVGVGVGIKTVGNVLVEVVVVISIVDVFSMAVEVVVSVEVRIDGGGIFDVVLGIRFMVHTL